MIEIKFKHMTYYSNTAIIKEKHIKEFCKQLPQFTNVLLNWKLQVILKIIGSAYFNYIRRVLSAFKSGHV